jgi:hypothetical protein
MFNFSACDNLKNEIYMNPLEKENSLLASEDTYHCFFEDRSDFEFPVFCEEDSRFDLNEVCPYEIALINNSGEPQEVLSIPMLLIVQLNIELDDDNRSMDVQFRTIEPEVHITKEPVTKVTSDVSQIEEEEKEELHKEFSDRIDVVLKKLLRGFRRYYIDGFYKLTNYKGLKKLNLSNEFYISCLKNYAAQEFSGNDDSQLVNFLEKLISHNRNMPKEKLLEVLYKFNFKKLKMFVENSQVRFLLNHYIDSIDMTKTSKAEKLGFEMIVRECNKN